MLPRTGSPCMLTFVMRTASFWKISEGRLPGSSTCHRARVFRTAGNWDQSSRSLRRACMMTNSVSPISATARAWANASSLASEKSDGWKIDLTNETARDGLLIVSTPMTYSSPNLKIHALAQIYQGLVKGVHSNKAQAWILDVQYDIHSKRHDQREAEHMEPTAHLAAGHAVARQQRRCQRQSEKHHEDNCRRVHLGRHGSGRRDIDHRVQRG